MYIRQGIVIRSHIDIVPRKKAWTDLNAPEYQDNTIRISKAFRPIASGNCKSGEQPLSISTDPDSEDDDK